MFFGDSEVFEYTTKIGHYLETFFPDSREGGQLEGKKKRIVGKGQFFFFLLPSS